MTTVNADTFKVRRITSQHIFPNGQWDIKLNGKHFAYANSLSAARDEINAAIALSYRGYFDLPDSGKTGFTFTPVKTFGELLDSDLQMMRQTFPSPLSEASSATEADEMPTMTSQDCAEMLGVSIATFWRRVADGTVPQPIKFGGLSRWMISDIEKVVSDAKSRRSA
ncbi:MAG: helix-turn-helix transcriptional regulator [Cypionkella sp.]